MSKVASALRHGLLSLALVGVPAAYAGQEADNLLQQASVVGSPMASAVIVEYEVPTRGTGQPRPATYLYVLYLSVFVKPASPEAMPDDIEDASTRYSFSSPARIADLASIGFLQVAPDTAAVLDGEIANARELGESTFPEAQLPAAVLAEVQQRKARLVALASVK
ncbi:MAG TPA: hypothetical protein VMB48_02710 [Steroidobacteraceae bacterium]|nr:hypothetical protein [Steroidobacteraceae bacterium]